MRIIGYYFCKMYFTFLSLLVSLSLSTTAAEMEHQKLSISTLINQHLNVAAIESPFDFNVTRNSTGHIIQIDGVSWLIFEWLSAAHINASFNLVPINPSKTRLDAFGGKPGIVEMVNKGEYDIMTLSVPTFSRAALVDYAQPIVFAFVSFLIPSPYQSVNLSSATRPFQAWVWVSLLFTIFIVFAVVILMEIIGRTYKRRFEVELFFYLLGMLLNQSSSYKSSKGLAIRLLIASWSIGAFLLINYYNSLYISFLAIPIKRPLIQSIQELENHPEIRLVADKNRNTEDLLFSAESGLLKGLADRLRADPGSRCNLPSQCVALVKEGHAVYTGTRDASLLDVLKKDFEETGKCNMEMGKESYLELQLAWASQKKSPYLDPLNKSFMRLVESGLLQKWIIDRLPKVERCFPTTKMKNDEAAEGREPLPLKRFSGAFIIFFVGILISLLVFIIETNLMRHIFAFKNKKVVVI